MFPTGNASQEMVPKGNPFKMPPDSEIFLLRDKVRERKAQENLRQRNLKVHEKTTYSTRVNFRTASMIHPHESSEEEEEEEDKEKAVPLKDDPQFTIAVTRDRHVEKESLAEYIAKKREMFLVQYSLEVKRDEMKKLEENALKEEKRLELAEQYLEEDAAMFDEFLKENDKNAVEAIKIAEEETKKKNKKLDEIKKINGQMNDIKSEIAKYEETLKDYQLYRGFLESLIPAEVQEERIKAKEKEKEEKVRSSMNNEPSSSARASANKRNSKNKKGHGNVVLPKNSGEDHHADENISEPGLADPGFTDMFDSDEELDFYFTDPQQLLDIFAELEEQNLSLIQNSQETEEALEELKKTIEHTKIKMGNESKTLKEQIYLLQSQIQKEEAKEADLKIKAKLFNYGEFKADDDQEQHLNELNKKVEEMYKNCVGDNEANMNPLQMLTNIENRLEELFELIETLPQDKVQAAEKAKDKERRLKLKDEKMKQARIHQEERVRKALERAKAEPKKQTGKRLVFRSEPPLIKKKEDHDTDPTNKEEEELRYYFSW